MRYSSSSTKTKFKMEKKWRCAEEAEIAWTVLLRLRYVNVYIYITSRTRLQHNITSSGNQVHSDFGYREEQA